MATLTIASFTVLNFHRPGTTARLKIWFAQDFVTRERQLVMGGVVRSGSVYLDIACTLDAATHSLTVPAFSLPTTNDSSVRNVRATGVLFDSAGVFVRNLFTAWIIPEQLAPNSDFAGLEAYNAAATRPPEPTVPTTDQSLVLINSAITAALASPFEAGDFNDEGNSSYISVDDEGGRANLFAGGEDGAQYAGVAAVCGVGQARLYLQATDYDYALFENGAATIGDATGEHNGAQVRINDPANMVLSRTANAVPADEMIRAEEVCWYLDEADGKLKARVRKSGGTYATVEISYVDD